MTDPGSSNDDGPPDERSVAGSGVAGVGDAAGTFGPAWSAGRRRALQADLRAWLEFAHGACDAADALALAHFRRDIAVSRKPDRTFVTAADQLIEREIRGRIGSAFPTHGLVGEEYGEEDGEARIRWYIDPIDGTHNFMRGVPLFGTLLAVEVDGELQVGAISAPAMRERWYAARGMGAWSRGLDGERRLHVSQVSDIADAQLLYGSGRDTVASGLMPGFDATLSAAWRERGFGDFWGYALVADGAAEAMFETGMHTWDLAAPQVLIEEAGGRVTDVHGERRIDAPSFIGSNGHLHEELLRRLAGGA
jgi:histidinol-phosphatase